MGAGTWRRSAGSSSGTSRRTPAFVSPAASSLLRGPRGLPEPVPSSSVGAASDLRGASAARALLTETSVWGSRRVAPGLSVGEPQFTPEASSLCQIKAEGFCSVIPMASARFLRGQPCGETSAICHFSLEGSIFKDPLGIGDFLFKLSHAEREGERASEPRSVCLYLCSLDSPASHAPLGLSSPFPSLCSSFCPSVLAPFLYGPGNSEISSPSA